MSHHIVEVNDLRHAYPDGTQALRGVTFKIHHGESVAVVGANGAGKSTLLLHLNGFLAPSSGTVRIQDPDDQLFMPTVCEDVAFGPYNLGLPTDEVDARVSRALSIAGVEHLANKPPHRLSGGEKRRVAIASVLSMSPDILVMDEPTTGLDPFARRTLIGLMKEFKHTRIFTTHDLDMVLDLCERTIVLHEGMVKADGPTLEIFSNEALLAECRLEKPLSMQGCPVCGRKGA